ncbi:hypothetical protein FACS1894168_0250 [Deltaproteobacteria bacterium]|nr:hypothetical protein FACS1894168_0250 [Deltaproteobacteria bacterium]
MGKYSKEEIIHETEKALEHAESFYQQPFLNYSGKTKDSSELYSEVISDVVLKNINKLKELLPITREQSYDVNHGGAVTTGVKGEDSKQKEKRLAIRIFKDKTTICSKIGIIIDYETPLNNKKMNKMGKIDLLAYNQFDNILYIIELKCKKKKEESLLRATLEVYTYYKIVDEEKLLKDFDEKLKKAGKHDGKKPCVKPAVLIFEDSRPCVEYNNNCDFNNTNNLLQALNVQVFTLCDSYIC